jgi:hypothetical protein
MRNTSGSAAIDCSSSSRSRTPSAAGDDARVVIDEPSQPGGELTGGLVATEITKGDEYRLEDRGLGALRIEQHAVRDPEQSAAIAADQGLDRGAFAGSRPFDEQ